MSLALCLKPSRSDGDVGAFGDGGEEALRFFNRRGKIGVREQNNFTVSLEHAGSDAVALATIAGILKKPNLRVCGSKGADDFSR